MATYGYTKWTCSQSLTVLERTISDLQAYKRLFSIHVIPWYSTLDGREKNMGTYGYTKWTCSQTLTVLERTISDLQA